MNLNINEHVNYLINHIKNTNPLAKLFRTSSYGYIYDTGTSKVMQCDSMEYSILEKLFNHELESSINDLIEDYGEERLLKALENLKNAIEEENILNSHKLCTFYSPNHFENLEEQINNNLEQLTLELTEQCNLRCEYCIYNNEFSGKRNHGDKEMSEEVARASVEYAAKHGSKNGVAITFYGGEPLIKFSLIKQCVEYSKEIIKDKPITYSLTTNLLLMTPDIAKYLASVEEFFIVCSIDGPKHMHDNFRKDLSGNGSFERVLSGLKYLVEALGDSAKDRIGLSMVYTPPYYSEKAKEIDEFFNSLNWLPKEVQKIITYPEANSIPFEIVKQKYEQQGIDFTANHNKWPLKELSDLNYLQEIKNSSQNKKGDSNYFAQNISEKPMIKIHKRSIFTKPNGKYPLNGCCIPGARKIYICTDGKFLLCEKISGSPIIGNVFSGIDIKKVKDQLIDEYSSKTIEKCSNCWAVRLCSVCYAHCYTDGKLDLEKRDNTCKNIPQQVESDLRLYHQCMESNPKALEYINDIVNI